MTLQEEQVLIKQRAGIKAKLTLFKKFVNNISDRVDKLPPNTPLDLKTLLEIEERVARQLAAFSEFDSIQNSIEHLKEDPSEQYNIREVLENDHFGAIAVCRSLLTANQHILNPNSAVSQLTNPISRLSNIQLPKIKMQQFNGSYEEWLGFRDTFLSLVHKRQDLHDMEKFHFLKDYLGAEPLSVIESLDFSEENYNVAWKLLCDFYDNKKMLVFNHLKSLLLDSPKLNGENAADLRKMSSNISKHLQALTKLKVPAEDIRDLIIIFLFSRKLDKKTEREWESFKHSGDLPTLDEFKKFLKEKADLLEKIELSTEVKRDNKQTNYPTTSKQNTYGFSKPKHTNKSFVSMAKITCVFCNGDHYITSCSKFLNLPGNLKIENAKRLKLCTNCLKPNHKISDCWSSLCKICKGKHHTLLHLNKSDNKDNSEFSSESQPNVTGNKASENMNVLTNTESTNCNLVKFNEILLSTALVNVSDCSGNDQLCRVLLDSGSQSNFISEKCCKRLGLKTLSVNISVSGINECQSKLKYKCNISIKSLTNSYQSNLNCFILPKICDKLPSCGINIKLLEIPPHLKLADPDFYKPSDIDILIGAELFYSLLSIGQINLGNNLPMLQKTILGWVISGPIKILQKPEQPNNNKISCNLSTNLDIQTQLVKFWEIEEPFNDLPILSNDEKKCEQIFIETTKRDQQGRFVVNIPFRIEPNKLGDSRELALKRFYLLENKLQKNRQLSKMYVDFMSEYEQLGHMSKVTDSKNGLSYFFPHHGVLKESSLTTKLRVVFDGSARTDAGLSLNDIQFIGPTIQDDLVSIILRFRKHQIVVCADIEKMYRMVSINPEQRTFQRIFWRSNPHEELQVYNLNTVTYGTASAMYLAVRCLKQLADENQTHFPEASHAISNDFYVDDFISGGDTIEQVIKLSTEVSSILKSGCFCLRKWSSNHPEVLKALSVNSSTTTMNLCDRETTKTLGLVWSPKTDHLMYEVLPFKPEPITKRAVLSAIAKLFDPLGLLSPAIVIAKIILQKLWLLKLSWDESLPSDLATTWNRFRQELSELSKIQVPRLVLLNKVQIIELHGFADASIEAYGACLYVRSIDSSGKIQVSLLMSKSRVAPLKMLTVPRLELSAALVLAKLLSKVKTQLNLSINSVFLWSDSSVALCWIKMSPHILQTFVANRVSQIQSLTIKDWWQHVNTKDNPADFLTRGVNPKELGHLDMWWHGPSWLLNPQSEWPKSEINVSSEIPEVKQSISSFMTVNHNDLFPFSKFSNLNRMKRAVAYCLRFRYNCQNTNNKRTNPLTVEELNNAYKVLLKISQRESFFEELINLQNEKPISNKSSLISLTPFLDADSIIRVGGRLQRSNFNANKKHPVLVSSKHPLTKLIFENEHIRLMHAGPQLLLSSLRETIWPISGKNLAKQVVHKCIRCFRNNAKIINPIMGILPEARVKPQPPFFTSGVDYAGPLMVRDRRGRGAKITKCYICLFVCFTTKAIHLELVSDLTKDTFIAALRRFVARRGRPNHIFSDNGSNFVAANKELASFLNDNQHSISENLNNEGITWSFIPPHSPHFGGLWESGVKSTKRHLKRVLSESSLTFEEYCTILVQIEAILNSRPLHPMSSDPNDLEILTPSHFLVGRRLTALPDPDLQDIPVNRLSRYQYLQRLQQHFWASWSRDYIAELQVRHKWKSPRDRLQTGSLVLVKDDHTPPNSWPLGRIIKLHPGPDGVARVATIKTKSGDVKRSFAKICVVPIAPSDDYSEVK